MRPIKIVEEEISYIENEIEMTKEEMGNPNNFANYKLIQKLQNELASQQLKLDKLYEEWEEIMQVIEEKENKTR